MLKPTLASLRPPAIAAGGIIAISLSVLLVCSLAADRLIGEVLPQERTCIPNTVTISMPFLGSDELNGAVTLNGDNQNLYAAFVNLVCVQE